MRPHEGETEGVMLPWGLVPEWAEGDSSKGRATSIDVGQVEREPTTRDVWANRRLCILPAAGFYVWQLTPMGYRQPYFVRVPNRGVFGIAALWDRTVEENDDDVLESCAILTMSSSSVLGITGAVSVPLVLARDDYEPWLNASHEVTASMLRPDSRPSLLASAISPRINALKYDDAHLIEPIDHDVRRSA